REPDNEKEGRRKQDWNSDNDDVDHESNAAARQHAFEQFRVGNRVVGMGLNLYGDADLSRSAVAHVQPSSLGILLSCKSAASSIDALNAGGTVIVAWVRAWRPLVPVGRTPGRAPTAAYRKGPLSPRGFEGMSITIADVEAARRTIAGQVLRTPMLPAPKLSALTGT